jgi:predicted nuclease of predicted toxin-antitoxin system
LGQRGSKLLRQAGHDVSTVNEQGMASAADRDLIVVCQAEQRCLVSLDLDFSNPLRFKPSNYSGIAVLRLPPKATPRDLDEAVQTLIGGLQREDITGQL